MWTYYFKCLRVVLSYRHFALFRFARRWHYFRVMDIKPAPKEVDDILFKRTSTDIAKLNKQSRAELRLKARRLWKENNALRTNPGPRFT